MKKYIFMLLLSAMLILTACDGTGTPYAGGSDAEEVINDLFEAIEDHDFGDFEDLFLDERTMFLSEGEFNGYREFLESLEFEVDDVDVAGKAAFLEVSVSYEYGDLDDSVEEKAILVMDDDEWLIAKFPLELPLDQINQSITEQPISQPEPIDGSVPGQEQVFEDPPEEQTNTWTQDQLIGADRPEAVVKAMFEAMKANNYYAAIALVHPDSENFPPEEDFRAFMQSIEGFQYVIGNCEISGDEAVVEFSITAVIDGEEDTIEDSMTMRKHNGKWLIIE